MFLLRVQEREECESIVGEGDGQGEEREREEEKKRTKKKHIDVVHRRWKTNPPPPRGTLQVFTPPFSSRAAEGSTGVGCDGGEGQVP